MITKIIFGLLLCIIFAFCLSMVPSAIEASAEEKVPTMVVKSAFLIMAPDGDPALHRTSVKTSMTEVMVVVLKRDFNQAVEVCQDLVQKEGVQILFLCPGFTHEAVAKISKAAGEKTAIYVARGDVPSTVLTGEILARAGFSSEEQ